MPIGMSKLGEILKKLLFPVSKLGLIFVGIHSIAVIIVYSLRIPEGWGIVFFIPDFPVVLFSSLFKIFDIPITEFFFWVYMATFGDLQWYMIAQWLMKAFRK